MKVHVCDSIMGSGKTESAITFMNEHLDDKFIFITPYLDEGERIIKACPDRDFHKPIPMDKGGKLSNLHCLLRDGKNIASTHALFKRYNAETIQLIQEKKYILIMDEVCSVIEDTGLTGNDIDILNSSDTVSTNGEIVTWQKNEYSKSRYQDIQECAESNSLVSYGGKFLFWSFPVEIFHSFKEVYVLTYLFVAQMQRCYFDMHGITYDYIHTSYHNHVYRFSDTPYIPPYVKMIKEKIHIIDDTKRNEIGKGHNDLSVTWYKRKNKEKEKPAFRIIRNNIYNVLRHKFNSTPETRMWTTFKAYYGNIKQNGYAQDFVSCNIRGTNTLRRKTHLAYCVNIFFNPLLKNYFIQHGVEVNEDLYALSEMIQWIWRSAIRDGHDIWIYIPSTRMRNLLIDWMNSLSEERTTVDHEFCDHKVA